MNYTSGLVTVRACIAPGGRLTPRGRRVVREISAESGVPAPQVIADALLGGANTLPVYAVDRHWRLWAVPWDRAAAITAVAAGGAYAVDWSLIVTRQAADDWTDTPARVLLPGAVDPDELAAVDLPWAPRGDGLRALVSAIKQINREGIVAVFDAAGRLARTPMLGTRAMAMVRDGRARHVEPAAIQLLRVLGDDAIAPRAAGYIPRWLVDPDQMRGRLSGRYADQWLDDIADWNQGVVTSTHDLMAAAVEPARRRTYPITRRGRREQPTPVHTLEITRPDVQRRFRRAHKRVRPTREADMVTAAVQRHIAMGEFRAAVGDTATGDGMVPDRAASARNVFVFDADGRPLPIRLTRADAARAVRDGVATWGLEWPGRVIRPDTHAGVYVPAYIVLRAPCVGIVTDLVLQARDMVPLRAALPAMRGGATVRVTADDERRDIDLPGWPVPAEETTVVPIQTALRTLLRARGGVSHAHK